MPACRRRLCTPPFVEGSLPAPDITARRSSDIRQTARDQGRAQRSFCARAKELKQEANKSAHRTRAKTQFKPATGLTIACTGSERISEGLFSRSRSPFQIPQPRAPTRFVQKHRDHGNSNTARSARSCAQMPSAIAPMRSEQWELVPRRLALPPQRKKLVANYDAAPDALKSRRSCDRQARACRAQHQTAKLNKRHP